MSDATERKLEWACREIERLCKEVSMIKNPEFWRLEAARQAALPVGDPCRTMSEDEVERFLGQRTVGRSKLVDEMRDSIAWSRPIWPCKVWEYTSYYRPRPHIETWCCPPNGPDINDTWFAVARCVANGKEYSEVVFYGGCPLPNTVAAKSGVRQKLIDRLCREGILTTEKSFNNPTGEPRIL